MRPRQWADAPRRQSSDALCRDLSVICNWPRRWFPYGADHIVVHEPAAFERSRRSESSQPSTTHSAGRSARTAQVSSNCVSAVRRSRLRRECADQRRSRTVRHDRHECDASADGFDELAADDLIQPIVLGFLTSTSGRTCINGLQRCVFVEDRDRVDALERREQRGAFRLRRRAGE